jgi:hypothetical protein
LASNSLKSPTPSPTPSYEMRKIDKRMRLRGEWTSISDEDVNGYQQALLGYKALNDSYEAVLNFEDQFSINKLTEGDPYVSYDDIGVDVKDLWKIKTRRLKALANYLLGIVNGTKPIPASDDRGCCYIDTKLDAATELANKLKDSGISTYDVGISVQQVREAVRVALVEEIKSYNNNPDPDTLSKLKGVQNEFGFNLKAMGLKETSPEKKQ